MAEDGAVPAQYAAGEVIYREGDPAKALYVLKAGEVRLLRKGTDGQQVVMAPVQKGSMFGVLSMLENKPHTNTAIAQTDVRVALFDRDYIDGRLEGLDPFSQALMRTLGLRLRKQSTMNMELRNRLMALQGSEKPRARAASPAPKKTVTKAPVVRRKVNFGTVNLALGDSSLHARKSLRDGLYQNEFRDLKDAASVEQMRDVLDHGTITDLLILDIDLGLSGMSQLIQDIRHGDVGHNPFMAIIGLINSAEDSFSDQLMESGADSVLARPFSVATLVNHIKLLCKAREPFVVTSQYVGPDRNSGKGVDGGQNAPTMPAPNTLFSKVVEGATNEQTSQVVRTAISHLQIMKLGREAYQINWLLERIKPEGGVSLDAGYFVDRIAHILREMETRIARTGLADKASRLRQMQDLLGTSDRDALPEDVWNQIKALNSENLAQFKQP